MNILKKINYKLYLLILVFLIDIIGFIYFHYLLFNMKECENEISAESIQLDNEEINDTESTTIANKIKVDIKGYVNKPNVYELDEGSRVIDLVNIAGGLKKGANTRFINLSKILNDQDTIVIYSDKEIEKLKKTETLVVETPCVCEEIKNDACITENTIDSNQSNTNNKININNATKEELMTLNGIGESKANNIIKYRESNKFTTIEDLKNVEGISESTFSKIKENITV